ncbi:DUF4129 domain-containing protein [Chloroflexus sp.]|uniref:DUF4129 domain-containing protein n=1 Tax=Chloroflexus sp. TaxID=1904827 RepID=UPI00260A666C|nr:DUF4129 domain-containing protein [uncultured Chloroflexus sp.]
MRIHLWFIILFVAWCGWTTPVAAQPAEVSLADYDRLLRATYAAAQRGDLLDLQVLARELIPINRVQMPDGQIARVDQRWLAEALAQRDPDLPAIAARLGALIDALAMPEHGVPATALQQWEQVLNEPPFNQTRDESWLTHFLNWLLEWFAQLMPEVPEVPVANEPEAISGLTPLVQIGLIVAAMLLGGVIIFWARGARRVLRAPVKAPAEATDDPVTVSEAQRLAAAARQASDRRSAVRYLYLAALLWLNEQGVLRYDRSLTNREYLQRLRSSSPARDLLEPVIATFDAVWYGFRPIDDQAFARYEEQVAAVQSLTRQAGTSNEAAT